jgi:hypothetical protein
LYPANDTALSVALGGSDPKTIRKYIWPMIESIAELDAIVVSSLIFLCKLFILTPLTIFVNRFNLKTGR